MTKDDSYFTAFP